MANSEWRPNNRLKQARTERGWSQDELAKQVNANSENELPQGRRKATKDYVGRWERGQVRPSPYFQSHLVQVFKKTASELGFVEPTVGSDSGRAETHPHSPKTATEMLSDHLVGGWPSPFASALNQAVVEGRDPLRYEKMLSPPYVSRTDLDSAITEHLSGTPSRDTPAVLRPVVLRGPPSSGKTRSAIESLGRLDAADAIRVLIVRSPSPLVLDRLRQVAQLLEELVDADQLAPNECVVFVDNLQRHICGGLNVAKELRKMCDLGFRVITTISDNGYLSTETALGSIGLVPNDIESLISTAITVPALLSDDELERAHTLIAPNVDIQGGLEILRPLAEYLGCVLKLRAHLLDLDSQPDNTSQAAFMMADLALTEFGIAFYLGIPKDILFERLICGWGGRFPTRRPLDPEEVAEAFRILTTPAVRHFSVLMPSTGDEERWYPHDKLLEMAIGQLCSNHALRLTEETLQLLESATFPQDRDYAALILTVHRSHDSRRLLRACQMDGSGRVFTALACYYVEQDLATLAQEFAQIAADLDDPFGLCLHGEFLSRAGDYENALKCFEKSYLAGFFASARGASNCCIRLQRTTDAQEWSERALEALPEDGETHYLRAQVLTDGAAQRKYMKTAADLGYTKAMSVAGVAVLMEKGDSRQAIGYFLQDPGLLDNGPALGMLSHTLFREGDLSEALRYAVRGSELGDSRSQEVVATCRKFMREYVDES